MIIIYTGNGKGKTSASLGQCIRAYGNNIPCAFVQFMKSDVKAGEQQFLKELLKENYFIGGKGFFTKEEDRPKHRQAVLDTLSYIDTIKNSIDMLICDEILYALHAKLITEDEINELLAYFTKHNKHIVLSGRYAPDWLIEKADIVSEIGEIKHACKLGVKAQKGIEY